MEAELMDRLDLHQIRRRLEQELCNSSDELEKLKQEIAQSVSLGQQKYSIKDAVIEDSVCAIRLSQLTQKIRDIRSSLERIKNGTFGRCERCRGEIPPSRLEAMPFARYCLRCQEQQEQEEI